jgi:hypothetical protein
LHPNCITRECLVTIICIIVCTGMHHHVRSSPYNFHHFRFLAERQKNLAECQKLFVRTFMVFVRGLRTTSTAFCAYDRKNHVLYMRTGTDSRAHRLHSHINQGQATGEWHSTLVASTTVVFLSIFTHLSSPSPTALVLAFSSFFIFITSYSASSW